MASYTDDTLQRFLKGSRLISSKKWEKAFQIYFYGDTKEPWTRSGLSDKTVKLFWRKSSFSLNKKQREQAILKEMDILHKIAFFSHLCVGYKESEHIFLQILNFGEV